MNKFNLILSLALTLSALFANAQAVSESLLARDLLASAKTTKTEKHIYNYFFMQSVHSSLTTPEGRKDYINRYLSAAGGNFWREDFVNTSPKDYAAGAGLYLATDPLISETYGDSFIELTLPAGTRFINVVHPIPLKKDTFAALISEGYINESQIALLFPKAKGFYRDTLRMMVDPQFSNFKKLVQRVFTQNQIQFVEYNFNSSLGRFCAAHNYSAFIYVGQENPEQPNRSIVPDAFKDKTLLFSIKLDIPNLSLEEQARRTEILKFRSTLEQIKGLSTASAKKIIAGIYTPAEVQSLKDSSLGCE